MSAPRTSASHPIRVDFLPSLAALGSGRLGMTFAPGKKHRGLAGVWDRELAADLRLIRDAYGADVLVSLVEDHELAKLGIADLVAMASAAGIVVERYPIPDAGVPRDVASFAALVLACVERVRRGETVVVHCKGGLGRTGLFTAACLRAAGVDAQRAMQMVRAARADTIENTSQEDFVRRFDPSSSRPRQPTRDAFRGCLLGGAIGDALGEPVEFVSSAAEISKRFGARTPEKLGYARSPRVTDDTQMTLFSAEGILRAGAGRWTDEGALVKEVQRAYLRWLSTQDGGGAEAIAASPAGWLVTERGLHHRRAPGSTCLGALEAQRGATAVATPGSPLNDSKGCGAVMRAAPFGLAARTRAQAFTWARDTGAITHGHPSGYLSAAHFAAVLWGVSRGEALADAVASASALLAAEPSHAETTAAVAKALALVRSGPPTAAAIESLGGAWVGEEALAIALLCAATCEGDGPAAIAAALWRSVAHAGDSDSTGSMTGNLLGAMHGVEALPPAWLAELELRDVIDRVAVDLHRCLAEGIVDDRAYPQAATGPAREPLPPVSPAAREGAPLTSLVVEARVFEDGLLGVKVPVALPPGTYDAVLVVGASKSPPAAHASDAGAEPLLPLQEFVDRARRDHIQRALAACGGNRTQAARLLGVDVRTVFRSVEKGEAT